MKLSDYRKQDRAFEEFLRYLMHDGDGIARIKPNGFLVGWDFIGPDVFGTSWSSLGKHADDIARVFQHLDERWSVHVTAHHHRIGYYPSSNHAPDRTIYLLDQARKANFDADGHHFGTKQRLWIAWQPFVQKNRFLNFIVGQEASSSDDRDHFLRTIKEIESILPAYFKQFTRIDFQETSIDGETIITDGLAQALGQELYGNFGVVVSDPELPVFLSHLLASPVDLKPHLRLGSKYVNVIVLRTYPKSTYPAMLDSLQYLPYEYRYSVRLTPYSPIDGKRMLGKKSRMHQLGALGIGLAFKSGGAGQEETPLRWRQDCKDAQTRIDEGAAYGSVVPQVVVYGETPDELNFATEKILSALSRGGFNPFIEDENNRFLAFLGTLPGECDANELRYAGMPLSSATRIMPLTSTWHGPEQHPDARFRNDDAPLLMLSTAQREPFRLYLHVGQLGHALIVGLPGRGKSNLMRELENAHLARYANSRVLSFDIGKSAYKFTHAINGQHYILGLGDGPQIAPLTGLCDEAHFEDIFAWAITFAELWRPEHPLSIEETKDLRTALHDLRSVQSARLSDLASSLQIPQLQAIFEQARGSLLDAVSDNFSFEAASVPYWCFEIGQLGIENHRWTVPTMMYLQRRAFAEFASGDAFPTMVTLDEAARAFKIPRVQDFAERLEREGRKHRVQFIFATQTPAEILSSEIRDVLIGTTATKIAMHNSEANNGSVRQGFLDIGFSEEDCATIANMSPFQALIKNDYGVQLVELSPTAFELAVFAGASEEDCRKVDQMIATYGKQEWLPEYLAALDMEGTAHYPALLRELLYPAQSIEGEAA